MLGLIVSCVDILENMQDEIWMSKMKICGQTERVWDAFNGVRANNDIVSVAATRHLIIR
jgi:hypothetical protein